MPVGIPIRWTDEEKELVCSLYLKGKSPTEISKIINRSAGVIGRLLNKLNVPMRGTGPNTEESRQAISEARSTRIPGDEKYTIDGYVVVYSPDHPYRNSNDNVRKHRLVMENRLGRFLLPEEVVHHINEIKDDNDPDNLELFASNSEHSYYHSVGVIPSEETRLKMSISQYERWRKIK